MSLADRSARRREASREPASSVSDFPLWDIIPSRRLLTPPSLAGWPPPDAERVRRALSSSLAESTRRAYLGHWAAFSAWCAEHGYSPAPAAPETVAAHLAAIVEACSASTLKVRRAAIGAAHRAAGLGDPVGSELVKRALAGLVRERAAPQRQARALGLAELAAIRATARQPRTGRQSGRTESPGKARARGLVDVALCSVLFFAGLRRSEAAALEWGNVEPEADGAGCCGCSARRPTRRRRAPRATCPGRRCRPSRRSARREPVRRRPCSGSRGRQIARRVAAAAAAAGLGSGFSGHSGRTGLAAELSRAGASTHEIAAAGGWKSAGMVIRYTRKETARRGAVARYLEGREEPSG